MGYAQAVLGFGGLALSLLFGIPFIYWGLANWARLYGDQADPVATMTELGSHVLWPAAGIALFGAGWLWALVTSCLILNESPPASPAPPRLD